MVKTGVCPIKMGFRRRWFCGCFLEMCQIFTVFQLVSRIFFEKKESIICLGKKSDYLCSRFKKARFNNINILSQ